MTSRPVIVCSTFTLEKRGNRPHENEDAAVVDASTGRFAVSDGATESWESRSWATALAHAYVRQPPQPKAFGAWHAAVRREWTPPSVPESAPWYASIKRDEGAFATLLGLELSPAIVPCFGCGAPLRMPVAVQKSEDEPPLRLDVSGPPTDLDSSTREPSTSRSTPDSPVPEPPSTPADPIKPTKPVAPIKPVAPAEPPPPVAVVSTPVLDAYVAAVRSASPPPHRSDVAESFDEPPLTRASSANNSGEEAKYKFMLFLGYLCFVVVPLGGAIFVGVYVFDRMEESKSPPDTILAPEDPNGRKTHPEPKPNSVGPPPPEGFASPWEKAGPVELRIAGVAIRHVPIINAERIPIDSPTPVLAIWVEARLSATEGKTLELRRWQSPTEQACRLNTDRNEEVPRADLGPGATLRAGLASKQSLAPYAPLRVELLVFSPPPSGVKKLTLTLDANRFGEAGEVILTIPVTAWKK